MPQSASLVLTSFEILVVRIPLRVTVTHHLADRAVAENIIVTATDQYGQRGWGECCPREYVTGESIASVQTTLEGVFFPEYKNRKFLTYDEVLRALTETGEGMKRNQQAAFCALELAVLDLAGKHFGRSLVDAIGGVMRSQFRYSGVIAAGDLDSLETQALRLQQFGFSEIKVKMSNDLDFNRQALTKSREIFGEGASLRVDANAAWTADEAIAQLTALQEFRLQGVEQPVAGDDFAGMAAVTAAGLTPVIADESLCSAADAERLIRERGCDIFNIRVSKCGGIINAARLTRKAQAAGLRCQMGAQVGETGILSAAGRHYASAFPDLLWLEGSFDAHLLVTQITTPDITVQPRGKADEIPGVGLGISVIQEELEAVCVERRGDNISEN